MYSMPVSITTPLVLDPAGLLPIGARNVREFVYTNKLAYNNDYMQKI